jgi:signal transduction histidine kinase
MALRDRLPRKPRIHAVLLLANLLLLLMPLGGLWLLRLYESALVRQTETELIAQAAVLGAAYRTAWHGGTPPAAGAAGAWEPRPAVLDLARDPVLPPAADALPATAPPSPRAAAAGAALQPVLADAQRVTLAGMRVLDANGTVIATSGGEAGLSLAARPEVATALAGRPGAVLRGRPLQPDVGAASISRAAPFRVFVAQPVVDGGAVIGVVLLSRTPASIRQALHGKRWELAGLAAALLAAAGLLALFTAYTVSRPIQAVAAQARAVAAGARVPLPRTRRSAVREADELWAAIHAMAGTLERRADYIGAFAAEVSHEFKTPLAAIRGALELLQDHGDAMTPDERARFLDQAGADVARLDRLVKRLLELARAEAPLPRDAEACDLDAALAQAAAPFIAAGLSVELRRPPAPLRAAIGAERLRTIIGNLLDNARRHGGAEVHCTIAWSVAAPGRIALVVGDDGAGISAGNAPRIFGRFFTTARDSGGTGLGLSIVRSHLDAIGGSIVLLPSSRGALFRIEVPAST